MKLQTYEEQQGRKREWMTQLERFHKDFPEKETFLYYLASYIVERTRDASELAREEQERDNLL
jgi:hypothetical protein